MNDSQAELEYLAARSEQINEAGLDAEDVFEQMLNDHDYGIAFVRLVLRMQKMIALGHTTHDPESER